MTWPAHRTKWRDQHIKWHNKTCHVATNHSSSPHVTSQPSTLLHLTPQATSWHQNRSHHHHGTAEGSFTAKKWFGHRAGRSPCAHSIGKFFLWLIVFFFETSAPGLSGHYWYIKLYSVRLQASRLFITCGYHVNFFCDFSMQHQQATKV